MRRIVVAGLVVVLAMAGCTQEVEKPEPDVAPGKVTVAPTQPSQKPSEGSGGGSGTTTPAESENPSQATTEAPSTPSDVSTESQRVVVLSAGDPDAAKAVQAAEAWLSFRWGFDYRLPKGRDFDTVEQFVGGDLAQRVEDMKSAPADDDYLSAQKSLRTIAVAEGIRSQVALIEGRYHVVVWLQKRRYDVNGSTESRVDEGFPVTVVKKGDKFLAIDTRQMQG